MSPLSYSLRARCIAEIIGTGVGVYVGEASIANALLPSAKGQGMGFGWIAFAYALAFFFPALFFGHISAILNPAFCVGLAVRGKLPWSEVFALSFSELLGGFLGGVFVWIHWIPHFKTVPEPPSAYIHDLLLRTRDAVTADGVQIASYTTHPQRSIGRKGGILRSLMDDVVDYVFRHNHFMESHFLHHPLATDDSQDSSQGHSHPHPHPYSHHDQNHDHDNRATSTTATTTTAMSLTSLSPNNNNDNDHNSPSSGHNTAPRSSPTHPHPHATPSTLHENPNPDDNSRVHGAHRLDSMSCTPTNSLALACLNSSAPPNQSSAPPTSPRIPAGLPPSPSPATEHTHSTQCRQPNKTTAILSASAAIDPGTPASSSAAEASSIRINAFSNIHKQALLPPAFSFRPDPTPEDPHPAGKRQAHHAHPPALPPVLEGTETSKATAAPPRTALSPQAEGQQPPQGQPGAGALGALAGECIRGADGLEEGLQQAVEDQGNVRGVAKLADVQAVVGAGNGAGTGKVGENNAAVDAGGQAQAGCTSGRAQQQREPLLLAHEQSSPREDVRKQPVHRSELSCPLATANGKAMAKSSGKSNPKADNQPAGRCSHEGSSKGSSKGSSSAKAAHPSSSRSSRALKAFEAALVADQNIKLSIFATRPAIYAPIFNFICEFLSTILLVTGIMLIQERGNALLPLEPLASGVYTQAISSFYTGVWVVVLVLGVGGPTGLAVNPARDLGPRMAHAVLPISNKGSSEWHYAWIPVVAPLLGGACGGALFMALQELQ